MTKGYASKPRLASGTFARNLIFSNAIGTYQHRSGDFRKTLKRSDSPAHQHRIHFVMTTLNFGLPTQIGMSYGLGCFPKRGLRHSGTHANFVRSSLIDST
jgi:hypothetical protein